MTYLLDTTIISELRRPRPDERVLQWWSNVRASHLYVSCLTIGELHRGIGRLRERGDHAQAELLSGWLDGLAHQFADRILPVDATVTQIWGGLPQRRPVPVIDGLIAATALRHELTVVTRNVRDYSATGAAVLDPFAA